MNNLFILPIHLEMIYSKWLELEKDPHNVKLDGTLKADLIKDLGKDLALCHIAHTEQKRVNILKYDTNINEKHKNNSVFSLGSKSLKNAFHPSAYTKYLKRFENTIELIPYKIKVVNYKYYNTKDNTLFKETEFIDYHNQHQEILINTRLDLDNNQYYIQEVSYIYRNSIIGYGKEYKGKTCRYKIDNKYWTKPVRILSSDAEFVKWAIIYVQKFYNNKAESYDVKHEDSSDFSEYTKAIIEKNIKLRAEGII